MTPCQLCRGACCESIVTTAPPTDTGFWLSLHGNTLPDGRLELPVPCHALAKCGSCTIHSMRPEHCRNFPVGGADCRATVLRRRPAIAQDIFSAMSNPSDHAPAKSN